MEHLVSIDQGREEVNLGKTHVVMLQQSRGHAKEIPPPHCNLKTHVHRSLLRAPRYLKHDDHERHRSATVMKKAEMRRTIGSSSVHVVGNQRSRAP